MPERLVSAILLSICFAVVCLQASCGDEAAETEVELAVVAGPLTSDTSEVLFMMQGDGIADGSLYYLGTRGSLPSGNPLTSSASFIVPEGRKNIIAWGYGSFTPAGSLNFPSTAYQLYDDCSLQDSSFTVQSRTNRSVPVDCTDQTGGVPFTENVGVENIILNGDYVFDANARNAGSFDGSNITRLVIDGAAINTTVSLSPSLDFDAVGCFDTLPAVWPDPSTWTCTTATSTDGNGDWVGYLVSKPGSSGSSLFLTVVVDTATRYLGVRVAGLAHLTAVAR